MEIIFWKYQFISVPLQLNIRKAIKVKAIKIFCPMSFYFAEYPCGCHFGIWPVKSQIFLQSTPTDRLPLTGGSASTYESLERQRANAFGWDVPLGHMFKNWDVMNSFIFYLVNGKGAYATLPYPEESWYNFSLHKVCIYCTEQTIVTGLYLFSSSLPMVVFRIEVYI